MPDMRLRIVLLLLPLLALGLPAAAGAQEPAPQVRLAAPADCLTNPNCGVGLRTHYGLRVNSVFVRLAVSDGGISALDDGLAEVAVSFTSSPYVSRPDIMILRDDRGLLKQDRIVPVVRTATLQRAGVRNERDIRAALNGASALLTTNVLRLLNRQVIDGRLPEAVGGEFVDANGLGGDAPTRRVRPIVIGYQSFEENRTLAHLYAAALTARGFRARVRPVRGFRAQAIREMRAGRIDMWPGYSRSLLGFLQRRPATQPVISVALRAQLKRVGAETVRAAPGEDRHGFVRNRAGASERGLVRMSDQ